jgi:hypothetical protein
LNAFISSICATFLAHPILLYLITVVIFEQYKLSSFSLCNFPRPPINSSYSCSITLVNTIFLNAVNVCTSPLMLDTKFQPPPPPYKATGTVSVRWTCSGYLKEKKIRMVGGGFQTGSTRHVGHFWPIVPAPSDCEDGEFGGMKIDTAN